MSQLSCSIIWNWKLSCFCAGYWYNVIYLFVFCNSEIQLQVSLQFSNFNLLGLIKKDKENPLEINKSCWFCGINLTEHFISWFDSFVFRCTSTSH